MVDGAYCGKARPITPLIHSRCAVFDAAVLDAVAVLVVLGVL